MAAASLTYTLTNGTTADADQVQQNFNDLKNYANNDEVRIDGTNAMTAQLTLLGTNPTGDNHAVRKAYMDGAHVVATGAVSQAFTASTYTTLKFATEVRDVTAGGTAASNYDLATGIFTAPVAGVYMASFCIVPNDSETGSFDLRFFSNSVEFTGPRCKPIEVGPSSGLVPMTMCLPLYVGVGQTILPQVRISSGVTRSLGSFLSIAWMHG